jgi:acetolactate synthase I/III small subunit
MKQTIQLLVENKPGVLMRVIGIIAAKGFNVESLQVQPDAGHAGITRILVVAEIDLRLRLRLVNEMNRLVQVLSAVDVSAGVSEDVYHDGTLLTAEQIPDAYPPASHFLVEGER